MARTPVRKGAAAPAKAPEATEAKKSPAVTNMKDKVKAAADKKVAEEAARLEAEEAARAAADAEEPETEDDESEEVEETEEGDESEDDAAETEDDESEEVEETEEGDESEATEPVFTRLIAICGEMEEKFALQGKNETPDVFFTRILECLSGADNDTFAGWDADIREWYNAAGTALEQSSEMPVPSGYEPPAVTPKKGPGRPAKDGAEKPAKAPKEPRVKKVKEPKESKRPRGDTGTTYQLRMLILDNLDLNLKDFAPIAAAAVPAASPATISVVHNDFHKSIRAIKAAGHWKD